jgi:glycosyltransferase involved in cell wall biosynthesis
MTRNPALSLVGVTQVSDAATVGVVVPAYRPDLDVLTTYLDGISETLDPARLRVELDAPTDRVRERLAGTPATVAVSPVRRGKGAAISDGFDALDTDVLAFADADGATPPPELCRVVEAVTGGRADLAVGSRRHPDATVETDQSPSRSLMGDGFAWMARRLLDVSLYDYQCGAKALTAGAWQQVRNQFTERGFAWDIELVAFVDAGGLQVQEVPITWHDHPESTVPPVRTAVELGSALVCTRYRTRRGDGGPLSAGLATLRPSKNE